MILSIAESFNRYFSVHLADTEQLKREVHQLRYRVYCQEFQYEDPSRFPNRQEQDEYDAVSYHGLILHKETGHAAACLRLVPALPGQLLPMEKHCDASWDQDVLSLLQLSRSTMCEISRLAVDRRFRQRRGEQESRLGQIATLDLSPDGRRTLPLIGIATIIIGIALTALTRRNDIFAMVEPYIPKLLSDGGIPFYQIGREIEYHGLRAPYYTRTENTLVNMRPELRDLYQVVNGALTPYFLRENRLPSNIYVADESTDGPHS